MGNMIYVPTGQLPPPECAGLTEKQRIFAEAYVETGGRVQVRAARMAGYAEGSASVSASKNLSNPMVLAYIKHIIETKMQAGVALAWDTLVDLCATGPPAVRRAAATEMLDRGGFLQTKVDERNININLNVRRTPDQVRKELKAIVEANPEIGQILTKYAAEEIDIDDVVEEVTQEIDWANANTSED